jgi:hypothetical protein
VLRCVRFKMNARTIVFEKHGHTAIGVITLQFQELIPNVLSFLDGEKKCNGTARTEGGVLLP